MKKTLIALTVAALPAAAMADVTLYGTVAAGIENNKTFSSGANSGLSAGKTRADTQINDWTTVLGFKGDEDLGNGLKAIWQVESRVYIDGSSSSTLATRDSFVGLSGNFGKVRMGRLSNFGNSDMETFDYGGFSGSSVAGFNYMERQDTRVNNSIRFDSPEFAGFSGTLLYGTDETRTDGTNNQIWNVGLSYNLNGFFAKYTYEHWGDAARLTGTSTSSTSKSQRLEAGYDANNLHAVLSYQQVQGYLGSDGTDSTGITYNNSIWSTILSNSGGTYNFSNEAKAREILAQVGYTFGNLTPYVSFVKGYKVRIGGSDVGGSDYKSYVLGAKYAVTKRTSFVGNFGYTKWGDNSLDKERSVGVGVIHNF